MNIDASGDDVWGGVRQYNGSGPAAEANADDVTRRRGGATPMPDDEARAAHVSLPDPISVGPMSGEMSLALDLSPEARRLLQGPQVPMHTRFGSSRPFGVAKIWRGVRGFDVSTEVGDLGTKPLNAALQYVIWDPGRSVSDDLLCLLAHLPRGLSRDQDLCQRCGCLAALHYVC